MEIVLMIVGLVICVATTAAAAVNDKNRHWREDAIRHGHAHYDSLTGKFEWNHPAECGNERNGE